MKDKIVSALNAFAQEKQCKVWLAVESGSRAWGFSSTDSDYDVRFVYAYPKHTYLQMRKPVDNYEWLDKENNIDFAGFDIYKYFNLLLNSNMTTIDWIFNPGIYADNIKHKEAIQSTILRLFDKQTYIRHNYSLCANNYHKYFETPLENEPTAKRYVYCIRALLSAQYCQEHSSIAPINFWDLVGATIEDEKDKRELLEMVEMKKKTREKQWYRNPKWQKFIQDKLHIEPQYSKPQQQEEYYKQLNGLLLGELEEMVIT